MQKIKLRQWILIALLLIVFAIKLIPHAGEWYAINLYPSISYILSAIGSIIPISIDEIIVVCSFIFFIAFPIMKYKVIPISFIVKREIEFCLWLYVWFYFGWACNYYRDDFYTRMHLTPNDYNKMEFLSFLHDYTDSINKYCAFVGPIPIDKERIQMEIRQLYKDVPASGGLCMPRSFQHPKHLLFNSLYSAVGVKGFMGPFAAESQLNRDILPYDYPSVYAHELSHLLSISNEAEANYWAYTTCTRSADKAVVFSGYFGIIFNVYCNAYAVLTKQEFEDWTHTLNPQILKFMQKEHDHWSSLRSPFLDKTQTLVFNWFLKSNNISSGIKNYDYVINMIIAEKKGTKSQKATSCSSKTKCTDNKQDKGHC